MGSIAASDVAQAVFRSVADEDTDQRATFKKMNAQTFDDWPNELGFDDLTEERGPIELAVTGSIPVWAAGSLFRTGPGQCKVDGTAAGTHYITHWFDGLAHTHRFDIVPDHTKPGTVRVLYASRRQSEERMQYIREHGTTKGFVSFAQTQDPCLGLLGKFMVTFKALVLHQRSNISLSNLNVVVQTNVPGAYIQKPSNNALLPSATKVEPLTTGKDELAPAEVAAALQTARKPSDLESSVSAASASATPATGTGTGIGIGIGTGTAAANTGHRSLPDSLWITTDANVMRQVDPATLEPIGTARQTVFHPDLVGNISSAHAEQDPVTGNYFNFNLEVGPVSVYRVFRVSPTTGKTTILASIRCGKAPRRDDIELGSTDVTSDTKPAYIHSMFQTKNYVVLCIPSTHFALNGLKILWTQSVVRGIEPFNESQRMRWIVVDKRGNGGVVGEYDAPAGFFFHSVNAFEETEADGAVNIVCDVVNYATPDIIQSFYYDVLLNRRNAAVDFYRDPLKAANVNPSLTRVRLPLSGAPVLAVQPAQRVWTIPGPHAGEMPTVNPRYKTKPHRFVYSMISLGFSTLSDSLCKTDITTRSALQWRAPRGHTPGEAVFIARPDGVDEDDGVLLSVVLNGLTGKSYLLCLDARTMTETGRAEVGFAIGFGFHGTHTAF